LRKIDHHVENSACTIDRLVRAGMCQSCAILLVGMIAAGEARDVTSPRVCTPCRRQVDRFMGVRPR
jgi:hypothetical protein